MDAVLQEKQDYILLVRNREATQKILSKEAQAQVVMHTCSPFNANAVMAYLHQLGHPTIRGVVCAIDALLPVAAEVAQQLACPFALPEVIARWLDKGHARQFCVEQNIAVPPFLCINSLNECELATWTHFPAIIKPRRGAGSLGVKRVDNTAAIIHFFENRSTPFQSEHWMIEALMSGAIMSAEGYVYQHEITVLGFSDRTWGPQPHFVEVGVNFPVLENTHTKADLQRFTEHVLRQSGYHHGFFHLELMLTASGIYLIELNLRYGGPLPMQIAAAYGANFYKGLFDLCVGMPPRFGKANQGCSVFYFYPPKQGVWSGFDDTLFERHPNVFLYRWNPNRQIGDVLGPIYSFRDYLCLVYVVAETTEIAHAITRALWSEFALAVHIEPIQKKKTPKTKRVNRVIKLVQSIRTRLGI